MRRESHVRFCEGGGVRFPSATRQGQCYLRLPFPELEGRQLLLTDLMGGEVHYREGRDLVLRGLYVDQVPWEINVFELRTVGAAA